MTLIEEVDRLGGAVAAVESGWVQEAIEQSAFEFHRRVQAGEDVIVGVNRYQSGESEPIELLRIEPGRRAAPGRPHEAGQSGARSRSLGGGSSRPSAPPPGRDVNVLPPMREALRVGATVGELCGVLRDAWGTHDAGRAPS